MGDWRQGTCPCLWELFVGDHGFETVAHELGHAFGLDHDFRNDAYMMSYGDDRDQLSHCAAEDVCERPSLLQHASNLLQRTWQRLRCTHLSDCPHDVIRFRFEATDADGLHQAQLIIPVAIGDPADGVKLHSCEALNGEINQIALYHNRSKTRIRNGSHTSDN